MRLVFKYNKKNFKNRKNINRLIEYFTENKLQQDFFKSPISIYVIEVSALNIYFIVFKNRLILAKGVLYESIWN